MEAKDYADVVTSITAVGAIGLSLWTIFAQRRHDRNSVRPLPAIDFGDYEDEIFVTLENAGVGPLIVSTMEVANSATGEQRSSLIEFMPRTSDFLWTTFVQEGLIESPLAAGDTVDLIRFQRREGNNPGFAKQVRDIRTALRNLKVKVTVRDIYGTKFTCERDLGWFGRLL